IDQASTSISGQNSHACPVRAPTKARPAKRAMKRHPSSRIGMKKLASTSVYLGKAEILAGVYQIGVANLIFVGIEDDRVLQTLAIMSARDVPEIVALDDAELAVVTGGARRRHQPLEREL